MITFMSINPFLSISLYSSNYKYRLLEKMRYEKALFSFYQILKVCRAGGRGRLKPQDHQYPTQKI
jgi:hypothetical protein